jgi:hypothetical protein
LEIATRLAKAHSDNVRLMLYVAYPHYFLGAVANESGLPTVAATHWRTTSALLMRVTESGLSLSTIDKKAVKELDRLLEDIGAR